jgi:hypothetical protein
MPAVNRTMQVYQRIWAILEADNGTGGWADVVKPGNRIRFDTGDPSPTKRVRQAGDAIEFELGLGPFNDRLDPSGVVFCGATNEIWEQTYLAILTTRSEDTNKLTLVAAQTLQLLRTAERATPKLGLSYVSEVGRVFTTRPRKVRLPDKQGQISWVVEMSIPIRMDFTPGT